MLKPTRFDWDSVAPTFEKLLQTDLTPDNIQAWLHHWSDLEKQLSEANTDRYRAYNENTLDEEVKDAYLHFIQEINPQWTVQGQALTERLLALDGYTPPPESALMFRKFRNNAELYREENVRLESDASTLVSEFEELTGAQMVTLDGEDLTVPQAQARLQSTDRALRERVWRAISERHQQDAAQANEIFLKLLHLRRQQAQNAGFSNYRAYRWQALERFDYTPEASRALQDAVAAEVVPLARKVNEQRRERLGLETLRPWDTQVDPDAQEPLKPFETVRELEEVLERIFTKLDPVLGEQFALMRDGYLDLESRPGKAPGGFCECYPLRKRPYIFCNATGTDGDVMVMLHEAGHAFHDFATMETQDLIWNHRTGAEFAEVASQTMELLALPYLSKDQGGFYTPAEAKRWRETQLHRIIHLLPRLAQGDAFQDWLYTEAPENVDAETIAAKWLELAARYNTGVDWTGLEPLQRTGWQFIHIIGIPFYLIEYGFAWLGALQIWRNALENPQEALEQYRHALSLGATVSLPELYEAAGAKFVFDRETVGELMRFLEGRLEM